MNLSAILLGRCPRCRSGHIFKPGLVGAIGLMNDVCEVCGLRFLRESGYFLGAMYVSYGLGVLTILPVSTVLAVVVGWPLWVVLLLMVVETLVLMPFFLRYSRVIWLYLDQEIDPR
ncbi:MAG TPA: DUF983 domain-containing protein [Dehalococcoidia bacterium]|nr:DUF983 domain-containing protein [Dehalococcoidia bacterium]